MAGVEAEKIISVMVVDDEPDIAYVIKKSCELASKDFRVGAFMDSGKALEHLRTHKLDYDLLLSHVRMPDVNENHTGSRSQGSQLKYHRGADKCF